MSDMIIKGLTQNNLKHVSLNLPKNKLIVFTGVSGSGKSSIVFDTIAAESQRQMNETYSAFVRGRLPKYEKPHVEYIDGLTASVIVDQTMLGGNSRSTVGTISDIYSTLRLLFSRIGEPYAGTASYFSFNDPNGMCMNCSGLGNVLEIDLEAIIDKRKSWAEGPIDDTMYTPGNWYWEQYAKCGLFDINKPLGEYTEEEYHLLMYGNRVEGEPVGDRIEGLKNQYDRLYLKRDLSDLSGHTKNKAMRLVKQKTCPVCGGKRLNQKTLACKVLGYSIADLCEMEFTTLIEVLQKINDPRATTMVEALTCSLDRMIQIGLPYLHLNRESSTLSGGEAQRLKLVRYMGSSLTGMTYIFDEPSTGLHPRDVRRMNEFMLRLRDKGNTVLVVEHDKDVISVADEIVDIGPKAGKQGGQIMFQGSYEALLKSDTLTGKGLSESIPIKEKVRRQKGSLPIRDASLHNLRHIDVDIPLGVMSVVTGVAGSGKSTLIRDVFAKQYEEQVIYIDQGPITATNRSMPATYLGFFDEIRKLFATANHVDASLFSFNSKGACPTCKGKGVIVTELVFMDPVITECEACNGKRYSTESLSHTYKGKNIIEVLNMTVDEALEFFEAKDKKIVSMLRSMSEVGLGYLSLGQPLSTLSGGERQRIKLAKYIDKKGNIYIFDEPTTGLHVSDIKKLMCLFDTMVDKGNTIIIIEHNLDVMKCADHIIDIGPDGGSKGGQVVYEGSPLEMAQKASTITAHYLRRDTGIKRA